MDIDEHCLQFQLVQVHRVAQYTGFYNIPSETRVTDIDSMIDDTNRIRFALSGWVEICDELTTTSEAQYQKVVKIFNFFIKVAKLNGLHKTPAVQGLEAALSKLRPNEMLPLVRRDDWQYRIGQLAACDLKRDLGTWRDLVFQGIPLFNIWDYISFIYTICAEPITSQLHAELHLVQFRTIVKAIRSVEYYSESVLWPSTVSATWTTVEVGQAISIAFGTACVGQKSQKHEMARVRREFMKTLVVQLEGWSMPVKKFRWCPNANGNCGEFLVWGIVCRQNEDYSSLCYNLERKGHIYKCCPHCVNLAERLHAQGITIRDLWAQSLLRETEKQFEDPSSRYQYCILRSVEDIMTNVQGSLVEKSRTLYQDDK